MRRILLSAIFLCTAAMGFAQSEEWYFALPEGKGVAIKDIDFFLAADDDVNFGMILKSGASFMNFSSVQTAYGIVPTGIQRVNASAASVLLANNTITLSNVTDAKALVAVYTLDGARQAIQTRRSEGKVEVDITGLKPQTYVLRVGKQTIKFVKK